MNLTRFLLAALYTLPFAIVLALIRAKYFPKNKSERIIEEAERAGRVTEGRLIKSKRIRPTPGAPAGSMERNESRKVVYEYDVNGRTYKWKGLIGVEPPERIDFYYPAGRPKKAIPHGYKLPGPGDVFWTVLPVILMAIIYNFFIN